jgi:hypothetical protein
MSVVVRAARRAARAPRPDAEDGEHLYYVVDSDKDQMVVHSVWGGPKERGPKL